MTPLNYMFSDATGLDLVEKLAVRRLSKQEAPALGLAALPSSNSIVFQGRPELGRWAFYREVEEWLEIVSPFGSCRLSLEGIDATKPIGLLNVKNAKEMMAWTVQAGLGWRDGNGAEPTFNAMKAKKIDGEALEPLHSPISFRGVDSKPDFWTMVLLPAKPDSIRAKGSQAIMEAAGRLFALPAGRASENVLAGKVQWGVPDETGFFVFLPR